jgi:PAS domain S-box-containing protein
VIAKDVSPAPPSDIPVYTADAAGTITAWNPAAEAMFGYSAEEIVGASVDIIIPPERHDEHREDWDQVRRGERVERHNTARSCKDGRIVRVSTAIAPIVDTSGRIVGASEAIRPAIDRRRHRDTVRVQARLIDLSYEPIFSWELGGGIIEWNTGCERLYGYSREEAIGRRSQELLQTVHPAPADQVLASLQEDRYWSGELRQRTKDGREVVVESRQQLFETSDHLLVLETTRDITQLRKVDADRLMLASVVESSEDSIVTKDLAGTITSWNRGAERLMGFSASEMIGRSIRLIIPEDRQNEEDEILERIRRGDGTDHFETERLRKDGTIVPVSLRVSPLRDGSGLIIGASSISRDITLRRRAAEQSAFLTEAGKVLQGSLDYQATLTVVANLAVLTLADWSAVDVVGEGGRIQRVAIAHADQTKIKLGRVVSARLGDASSPYSVAAVIRTATPVIIPVITDEIIVAAARGDQEGIRLARTLGLVSYICVPLVAHGRTLGALTFFTAQSGRRYGEDDLRFAQDLAYRAALAVDNAQAFKEAQLANHLKDEFLATLSHELRTPLNAILGYARLLRSGITSPERQANALRAVERNATALATIVEDVLDVSRIIAGKVRLSIQSVDAPAVVRNAVETIRPAADAKEIRLQTFLDPNAAPISGDPDRLQQIVWNLVSNAVKFTPKGGTVQVRLERVGSHIDLVVSDTGIGINPEFLPHIFERFRQADSATTRERGGLGLGLAIVRHLVELHGGHVEATSDGVGKGSTFRVRLPVMIVHRQATAAERRARANQEASRATAELSLAGIRVLAVDDDVDAQRLVREILEEAGAAVITVDSSLKALDVIAEMRPHVVISEIGLPVMDGFELVERIRRSPDAAIRNIPAAAVTAYARSEDRVNSLKSGFQIHLSKPVDPVELVAVIASLAGRHSGG